MSRELESYRAAINGALPTSLNKPRSFMSVSKLGSCLRRSGHVDQRGWGLGGRRRRSACQLRLVQGLAHPSTLRHRCKRD